MLRSALKTLFGNRMSFRLALLANRLRLGANHVLVVNLHDTPLPEAPALEAQMRLLQRHFDFAPPRDALRILEPGAPRRTRPAILFTFDDGLRSNYDCAAPLLEKLGTRGVFLVPNEFVSEPTAAPLEREYARATDRSILVRPGSLDPADPRCSMTWEQVRDLHARGHVIGCHTETHCRLGPDKDAAVLRREVPGAKRRLEEKLGAPVDVFCWVGGETENYSRTAAAEIRKAGFRYSLMSCLQPVTPTTDPLAIQRVNFESNWPMRDFFFAFSLFQQIRYRRKSAYVSDLA